MAAADTKPQETKRTVWRVLGLVLALAGAGIIANSFRSDELGLSRNVREAVAKQLGKKASALTTVDCARVRSLDLNCYASPIVRLPASFARWQNLIPYRQNPISDDDLASIGKLSALLDLYLVGTQVSDAGLTHLKELPLLEFLNLDLTHVTDSGLLHLSQLAGLHTLLLDHTQVSDAGLIHLDKLSALEMLSLQKTPVTDAGLVHLTTLPMLKELYLGRTGVTAAGVKRFKEERRKAGQPECEVY